MELLIKLMQKSHTSTGLPYQCAERLDWCERLGNAADLLELFDNALCEVIQQPDATVEDIENSVRELRLFSRCALHLIEDIFEDIDTREFVEEREAAKK